MAKEEEWERSGRPVYNIKLCSIIRIFLNKTNLIHFTHKISIQNNVMILFECNICRYRKIYYELE